jgi:hypothetical protein
MKVNLAWPALLVLIVGCAQDATPSRTASPQLEESGPLKPLGQRKLDGVTPYEGFAYFSGNLNTNSSFPTIYYSDGFSEPRVTVLAPNVLLEYPISQLDVAIRIFKLLCSQHTQDWKDNQEIMVFGTAYLKAQSERNKTGGNVRLQDILKDVPTEQHDRMTLLYLKTKEPVRGD